MLNGIHGHQDIERIVFGRPAGPALRAEAERLGARRVFVTTTRSVAQSALLADVIRELGDRYAGVYAGITAHSPRPCVIEGAQMAREAKADLLVAGGGGTSNEALKLLARALPAHKAKPDDLATRLDLQFGMWLSIGAGTSGVGVGASHGIGHVLGAACHVPHGHTSCVMLPSVLRWNLPANSERQKRVSEAFDKPDAPA